jgi:hypothetical protein
VAGCWRLRVFPEQSFDHPELTRRRVDSDQQRPGHAGHGNDGLARRQVRQTVPEALVNATNRALQTGDDVHVGDLVQDEYHWGDFKHDPKQVLARYFDAFLYYANWGCQRLAFRLPKGLLDEGLLQPYLWEYCADLESVGDALVLDISFPDEDGGHWFEGEARLGARGPHCATPLSGCARPRNVANKPKLRPSGSKTCRILRPAPRRPGAMCKH